MGLYLEEKQIFVLMFKANFLRLGLLSFFIYICIYIHITYIVILYVDDLIFTGNNELMFSEFKTFMLREFDMTDLGRMRFFLGIEVLQRREGIYIY